MNTLNKLLEGGVPFNSKFVLLGTSRSRYLDYPDSELVDRYIQLFKDRTVMNINEKVFLQCLKGRNPNVVEIDSLAMLKYAYYDQYGPIEFGEPVAQQEEDPELVPGPKAEFKKTPLESLKKKKAAQAVSPSPLLKGLLGTK